MLPHSAVPLPTHSDVFVPLAVTIPTRWHRRSTLYPIPNDEDFNIPQSPNVARGIHIVPRDFRWIIPSTNGGPAAVFNNHGVHEFDWTTVGGTPYLDTFQPYNFFVQYPRVDAVWITINDPAAEQEDPPTPASERNQFQVVLFYRDTFTRAEALRFREIQTAYWNTRPRIPWPSDFDDSLPAPIEPIVDHSLAIH